MYKVVIALIFNASCMMSLCAQGNIQYLRYQFTVDVVIKLDNSNAKSNRTVDSLIESNLAEENLFMEYYFNDECVRLPGADGVDWFYEIDEMKVYEYSNYDKHMIDTIDLTEDLVWDRTYDIKHYTAATKDILGFECYRILITETNSNRFNAHIVKNYYELYVTADIKFPAFIPCGFKANILELCPLEINGINDKGSTSYNILTAV